MSEEDRKKGNNWLQSTPKVLQKFTNDTNFDQDKKTFESQPNVNISKSLPVDDQGQVDSQSYVSISIHPPPCARPNLNLVW